MRKVLHGLLAIILIWDIGAANAADNGILTAKQAYDKARSGSILLVDVRSPQEWKQTGVPAGGIAETIHRDGGLPAFVAALLTRLDGDRSKPVALICAQGGRSAYTREYLEQAGFTNVSDVSEGMTGGRNGKGWARQHLPTSAWKAD